MSENRKSAPLPADWLDKFAGQFEPLTEEQIAHNRAERERAEVAYMRLRSWAFSECGLLSLVVETLANREHDETLGHIKVYDDGGKCLGYLCDIVRGLDERRTR